METHPAILLSLLLLVPFSLSIPMEEEETEYGREVALETNGEFLRDEIGTPVNAREKRDYYYDDYEEDYSNSIYDPDPTLKVEPYYGKCGRKVVKTTEGLMRILGGRNAQRGSWPWQVAILDSDKDQLCGGTLIGTQWVLTAAHCLDGSRYIRLGEHDLRTLEKSETELTIDKSIMHPDYNDDIYVNDIGLLKLSRPVKYTNYMLPACLPDFNTEIPLYQKCYITGWGRDENGQDTDILQYGRVPITNNKECQNAYSSTPISDEQICAGYQRGSYDACSGDSGGPLICEVDGVWTVHGITSFGKRCGFGSTYGVYTKVKSYRSWIKKTMAWN